ncbi:lysozyme inhibitor [Erwinia sp. CPCC 100877]|nr:lysozyme inhibitor [Erwinia sp. CPCC 100877]
MKKLFILLLPAMLGGCSYYHSVYNAMMDKMNTNTLEYQCDEQPLSVSQNSNRGEVHFVYNDKVLRLKQGISASGVRYSDGIYVFWSKGDTATVWRQDSIVLHHCRLQNSES